VTKKLKPGNNEKVVYKNSHIVKYYKKSNFSLFGLKVLALDSYSERPFCFVFISLCFIHLL